VHDAGSGWRKRNERLPSSDAQSNADSVLEPGMVLVVEGYFGKVGADHGVKLGDQLVVTEDGARTVVSYPWSDTLLAG
jgi:Xaa-Pro aminopeptidase